MGLGQCQQPCAEHLEGLCSLCCRHVQALSHGLLLVTSHLRIFDSRTSLCTKEQTVLACYKADEVLKWKPPQTPVLNWTSAIGKRIPFLPSSPKHLGCCFLAANPPHLQASLPFADTLLLNSGMGRSSRGSRRGREVRGSPLQRSLHTQMQFHSGAILASQLNEDRDNTARERLGKTP